MREEGFEVLKEEYMNLLYLKNEVRKYEIKGVEGEGEILGISDLGKLQLKVEGEVREFNFREIKYLHK